MSIRDVKATVTPALMEMEGVVGVGRSNNKLRVYVQNSPTLNGIPHEVAGYNVEVVHVGHIRALSVSDYDWPQTWVTSQFEAEPERLVAAYGRTDRFDPLVCGVSIAHKKVTAGTLGFAMNVGGKTYGVSNNHVLANASSVQVERAKIGDEILQPGPADGGVLPSDIAGTLSGFVPIDEINVNLLDLALFEPTRSLSPEILGIGIPNGFTQLKVGDKVRKSGRTSGVTYGTVQDIDATLSVDYGEYEAVFDHLVVTDGIAQGGDSGSALIRQENLNIGGLLFAGSEYITCHMHINTVLNAFDPSTPPEEGRTSLSLGGLALIPLGLGMVWASR